MAMVGASRQLGGRWYSAPWDSLHTSGNGCPSQRRLLPTCSLLGAPEPDWRVKKVSLSAPGTVGELWLCAVSGVWTQSVPSVTLGL